MRTIAIIDTRQNFINDISTRIILNEGEYNFEVTEYTTDLSAVDTLINDNKVDEICISENVADTREDWDIVGPKITSYAVSLENVNMLLNKGLLCYGVVSKAGDLFDLIEKNKPASMKQIAANGKAKETDKIQKEDTSEIDALLFGSDSTKNTAGDEKNNLVGEQAASHKDYIEKDTEMQKKSSIESGKNNDEEDLDKYLFGGSTSKPTTKSLREKMDREEELERERSYANIDAKMRKKRKKAHVITTYSAKGGVGKTTISCNLGTYLAMTSNGRRNNRVCIIDYNFDFGDVLNTLAFNSKGVTMSDWVEDIQSRLGNGEDPDAILYGKDDIESFLQRKEDSGLYALLAPTTHKDALMIHGKELNIMLKNILKYGDFDYVICDTGNNTRNSSMLSLENADSIIMIATQDVTTVYDNQIFLDAIKEIGNVDESRILLVINRAKSKKETLVSCKEVEDSLDIPCVAQFREDVDITKANNTGKPLVFNAKHEFTQGISNIAARITGIGEYKPVKTNFVVSWFNKIKDFFGF